MRTPFLLAFFFLAATSAAQQPPGLSAKYPSDANIAKDPAVFFADDFESPDLKKWDEKKGPVQLVADAPHAGRQCVAMPMNRGKDTGGHLIKWFMPGHDTRAGV